MKKLYFLKDNSKHYWECWGNDDRTFTVHWGELGFEGESEIISGRFFRPAKSQVKKLEKLYASKGYEEVDLQDQKILLIEYTVDGFGSEDDLKKRHLLEGLMNETLGWTGLGHCDGGSIGSGTMEVCCFVVDFEKARQVISDRLNGTEFSDYTRIYQEE